MILSLFQDPLRHDFEWTWLFESFPYAEKHQQFLRIALCAPTFAELHDWAGWVKSRLRFLILKVLLMQLFCCFFMLLLHKSYGSLLIFGIFEQNIQTQSSLLWFCSWKGLALGVTRAPQRRLIMQSRSQTWSSTGASSLKKSCMWTLAL